MYENFKFLTTDLDDENEFVFVDIYVDEKAGQVAVCQVGGYPQDSDSTIYGGKTAKEILARFDY